MTPLRALQNQAGAATTDQQLALHCGSGATLTPKLPELLLAGDRAPHKGGITLEALSREGVSLIPAPFQHTLSPISPASKLTEPRKTRSSSSAEAKPWGTSPQVRQEGAPAPPHLDILCWTRGKERPWLESGLVSTVPVAGSAAAHLSAQVCVPYLSLIQP